MLLCHNTGWECNKDLDKQMSENAYSFQLIENTLLKPLFSFYLCAILQFCIEEI